MDIKIKAVKGTNAFNVSMQNMPKGKLRALVNALKVHGTPVALELLELIKDELPAGTL